MGLLKKLYSLHVFSSTWNRGLVGKELGLFTDSPFILSKFLEIQDGSPNSSVAVFAVLEGKVPQNYFCPWKTSFTISDPSLFGVYCFLFIEQT